MFLLVYNEVRGQTEETITEKLLLFVRGNFFIPDARVSWVKPSFSFLSDYIKIHKVDTIITTGPPHSLHFHLAIYFSMRSSHQESVLRALYLGALLSCLSRSRSYLAISSAIHLTETEQCRRRISTNLHRPSAYYV